MLVYEGIKSGFINDVDLNLITDKILNRFKEVFHRSTGESEINSWRESMLRMRGVLADKDIPDNAGVAIEFNIPHTSNRIDFLLSGYDKNKNNSIIIKEIDISNTNTYDEVIFKILENIESEDIKKNFYKIILKGQIKEHFTLNENILMERLKDKFYYIKIVNDTSIGIDLEQLSMDYSIKGKFIENMFNKINNANDEEKEILELALKIGIKSLLEEEVNLNDY